mmetsp:Transcript_115085/g.332490  ORF Transcript_115085/g.332490 Transcript_115085/m.332490 type:complete len:201 (-) Transcript_115085:113-715(-)
MLVVAEVAARPVLATASAAEEFAWRALAGSVKASTNARRLLLLLSIILVARTHDGRAMGQGRRRRRNRDLCNRRGRSLRQRPRSAAEGARRHEIRREVADLDGGCSTTREVAEGVEGWRRIEARRREACRALCRRRRRSLQLECAAHEVGCLLRDRRLIKDWLAIAQIEAEAQKDVVLWHACVLEEVVKRVHVASTHGTR